MLSTHKTNPQKRVYLDYNATTPPSALLAQKWGDLLLLSGNPSSVHFESRAPKAVLRETRQKIANLLGCSNTEIIFNSGASEGNASVFRSVFESRFPEKSEFIISSVEHPSVVKSALALKAKGAIIHTIPVDRNGNMDLEFLKSKLSNRTALVSVMFANNETGVLHPIKEICDLAHEAGALMHSDCVQMLGKALIDFKPLHLDYATFSAHKFYALKGTGFCFVKNTSPWTPLIHGSQERSRRGGTENTIGIAALNIVLDELSDLETKIKTMQDLRDRFESEITQKISDVRVTASNAKRVANTSSLVIDGIDGETLLMSLDLKGFAVSTGAACSSGSPEPSPVLLAMGLSKQEAQASLRISLGWQTAPEEIDLFIDCLIETVEKLRALNNQEKKNQYAGG